MHRVLRRHVDTKTRRGQRQRHPRVERERRIPRIFVHVPVADGGRGSRARGGGGCRQETRGDG